MKKGIS